MEITKETGVRSAEKSSMGARIAYLVLFGLGLGALYMLHIHQMRGLERKIIGYSSNLVGDGYEEALEQGLGKWVSESGEKKFIWIKDIPAETNVLTRNGVSKLAEFLPAEEIQARVESDINPNEFIIEDPFTGYARNDDIEFIISEPQQEHLADIVVELWQHLNDAYSLGKSHGFQRIYEEELRQIHNEVISDEIMRVHEEAVKLGLGKWGRTGFYWVDSIEEIRMAERNKVYAEAVNRGLGHWRIDFDNNDAVFEWEGKAEKGDSGSILEQLKKLVKYEEPAEIVIHNNREKEL